VPLTVRVRARLAPLLALFVTAGLAVAPAATQASTEPDGPRPNLIVFMTDDQRYADTLDVMPQTMRYFGAEGTVFPNGFANTPLCCPSRSTTFSGRYTHNHGNLNNQTTTNLDYDATFQAYLKGAGYQTGLVGKFLIGWNNGDQPPHTDYWALSAGGYLNVPWGTDEGSLRADYTTHEARRQALRILDNFEQDDDRPFVLYIATQAPHSPWEPEAQYATADIGQWAGNPSVFETDRSDKPSWVRGSDWTYEESLDIRTNQLRTLKSVDDMVGAVMDRLDELGEGSNTVSVFTSDNGYQWGEHGLTSKYHPYNNSINVPFMVRWPGHVPAGRVDRRLVGNVDITPSLLAAARVTPELKYPLDGIPFLSATGLAEETRPEAYLEFFEDEHRSIPNWSSIRTEWFQYVEYERDGTVVFREYYDLYNDPHQLVNLLKDGKSGNDPDTTALSARLAVYRQCSGAAGALPCVQESSSNPPPPPTTTTSSTTTTTTTSSSTSTSSTTTTTRPGGSGTTTTTAAPTTTTTIPAVAVGETGPVIRARSGYWMLGTDGTVYSFGDARHHGDVKITSAEAVDLEPVPLGNGYWVLSSAGMIAARGDARHHGNATGLTAGERAVSLSRTPSGNGYWIFTDRGRVIARGDAAFQGDMSGTRLNGPILDSIATPTGKGYYMVASDGGIFAFGDAAFHGSMGGTRLNAPVQSLVPDPDGSGYWLVASDGGVFAFAAGFRGSMGGQRMNAPVTGMVPNGSGYLMVATDGGIFNFSDQPFHGSLGANPPAHPIAAVAAA
jgi:arylsulfatase A-like enzyme